MLCYKGVRLKMPVDMLRGIETCSIHRSTDYDELNSALPGTSAVKKY